MRFLVSSTVRDSSGLEDELTGVVYGGVFRSAQVGGTGPRDDAVLYASVELADVDLTTEMISAGEWTSDELVVDTYTFLGFFDVDASSLGSPEPDPEDGDPVTLPTVNQFTIEEGMVVDIDVQFDLVL
jgi:hypothetical protein